MHSSTVTSRALSTGRNPNHDLRKSEMISSKKNSRKMEFWFSIMTPAKLPCVIRFDFDFDFDFDFWVQRNGVLFFSGYDGRVVLHTVADSIRNSGTYVFQKFNHFSFSFVFTICPLVVVSFQLLICGWALLVCASRAVLGRHYIGDVVAGAALGLFLAWIDLTFFWMDLKTCFSLLWPLHEYLFI